MAEFWAVVGRMCVDVGFHTQLFNNGDFFLTFNGLVDFRRFLAHDSGARVRLSRYEVMELNRIVKTEIRDNTIIHPFGTLGEDTTVAGIRAGFSLSLPIRPNLDLYAVIGLACIEGNFLSRIHAASNLDPDRFEGLRALFSVQDENTPHFELTDANLRTLNVFLRSNGDRAREFMNTFRVMRWVQPAPCSVAFGTKVMTIDSQQVAIEYEHVSQPELHLTFRQNQSLERALKEGPAIQWPGDETRGGRADKLERFNTALAGSPVPQ